MNEEDIYYSLQQCLEQELYYLIEEEECDKERVFQLAAKAIESLRDNFKMVQPEEHDDSDLNKQ